MNRIQLERIIRAELQEAGMKPDYFSYSDVEYGVRCELSARSLGEVIAQHQQFTGPPVGLTYTELAERIYRRLENDR